jgi:hypothetical protein
VTASSQHTGWYYDSASGELQVLINGTEVASFSSTGISVAGAAPNAQEAHIADVSSTDSGTGGNDATFVTAINSIIAVLEQYGFTATS